jgi:uncharacterized protein
MDKQNYREAIRQKIVDSIARPMPLLTQRDVWLPVSTSKATAVIGMRRVGKTSLLWQIMASRLLLGAPRESLLYFSFEDERLVGMQAQDLQLVIEEYYKLYPERRDLQETVFLLDEIQLVTGWETFVRRVLDSETIKIYLSGSSAKLLSREIASSMRGRVAEVIVTPFSFKEFLRHHGVLPSKALKHVGKAERSLLHQKLVQYLAFGGFPEVQSLLAPEHTRERLELLKTYVDVVLLRDVIERHNVTQPQVLRWLVQQLLGNAAGAFCVNRFFNDLKSRGVAVGKERLHEYLAHLEDTFLITSVSIATESIRRRQVNPRKSYPVDTGLSALFDPIGKPNTGHALETIVLQECLRRGNHIAYVITASGFEVDFLAESLNGEQMLIQVCADIADSETYHREMRALREARIEYPRAQCLLISLEPLRRQVLEADIQVIYVLDWLLE